MSAATGYGKEPEPSTSSSSQLSQHCCHFKLFDILLATENFDESLVIGRGGFGKVYRGTIFTGSATVLAAIKRLDPSSNQGAPEFWAEVEMLSKLRHCNLVSLFGYCNDEKEMILVYEYMPNGTLEDHLHKLGTQLSWVQRLNICIGACRGLHYLHTGTGIDFGVIHRDVKTSNILLQESWASKISDFGLSKIGPTNQPLTYVNTLVKGTFGYFDPDYYATGNLTRKSDVYAFGVVLLEVLCRKRAIFDINGEALNLAKWAQESIKKGSLKNIIDFDIRGQVSPKCSKKFVQIVKRCLHGSPKKRSTMAEVLSSLESILSLQEKFNNSVQSAGRTILFRMVNMLTFTSNGENTAISQTTITANSLPSGASSFFSSGSQFSAASGSDSIGPGDLILPHPNLRLFSFAELKTATRNFRSDTVLGEGGFGKVYKGWLEDKSTSKSTVIAVKKLNSESMQGLEEWQAEVDFLGRLSHPNLVKLLGYCYEGTELLLVYEFMQKGSLEKHLFGRGSTVQPLPWDIRLKISIGAGRGLAFLHASEKKIIYRDFKTSNILLDGSYNAKLSDFGLAKIGPSAIQSHVTTRVMGTYGYAAPEYVSTGHLYVKSDVYGFGVVLVEMLTGLRALDPSRPANKQNLIDWIKPFLTNGRKLKKVMDSRLEGRYPSKATSQIAQLASTCLGPEPKTRPSMKEIVEKLEKLDAINERPKVPRVNHSSHSSPYRHSQQPSHQRRSPSPHATPKGNRRTKRSTKRVVKLLGHLRII